MTFSQRGVVPIPIVVALAISLFGILGTTYLALQEQDPRNLAADRECYSSADCQNHYRCQNGSCVYSGTGDADETGCGCEPRETRNCTTGDKRGRQTCAFRPGNPGACPVWGKCETGLDGADGDAKTLDCPGTCRVFACKKGEKAAPKNYECDKLIGSNNKCCIPQGMDLSPIPTPNCECKAGEYRTCSEGAGAGGKGIQYCSGGVSSCGYWGECKLHIPTPTGSGCVCSPGDYQTCVIDGKNGSQYCVDQERGGGNYCGKWDKCRLDRPIPTIEPENPTEAPIPTEKITRCATCAEFYCYTSGNDYRWYTKAATRAAGYNTVVVSTDPAYDLCGPKPVKSLGNANCDSFINQADCTICKYQANQFALGRPMSGTPQADFTCDGRVDLKADCAIIPGCTGNNVVTPTSTTSSLRCAFCGNKCQWVTNGTMCPMVQPPAGATCVQAGTKCVTSGGVGGFGAGY